MNGVMIIFWIKIVNPQMMQKILLGGFIAMGILFKDVFFHIMMISDRGIKDESR